ncbi:MULTISPECIES: relaxase/mobilization nuclease domain-containing protein [Flavobacterium]|uniref:relaxase/mobilization nuclease domain-containing protein n=5 Tax=Flavobacteriaceae TaxID=49546 RepID=UPI00214D3C19|nr:MULTISPECIES: relaxase/mobilization nuclease domain-containing protein [Flavobacterium]UUW10214.1 relaxase/mobilization nuclease domain-containing protein [Flavobacterium plurextorum]
MVGKAKSIAHTSNAVNYGKDKLNAEEISRHNVIGSTGLEIENEFKVYQNLNLNTKMNTISIVLSPSPEDGRKLSREEFKAISDDYLKKMNLQDHQHVAYVHRDTDHTHIHLYVNRINSKGVAYNDSFISKRTQQKTHEIAKERGLVSAKEVMASNDLLKSKIFEKHLEVLKQQPQSFQDYIKQMDLKGLEVKPTINRQGQIQGFRVRDLNTNKDFKASECHRSMSASNLLKIGINNDLGYNVDTTLKRAQGKQISKNHSNKNLSNIIPKEIKNQVNQLSRNGTKSVAQVLGKQKITKEEFKYIKAVQNPLIKVEMKNTEKERLDSVSKDIEYAKNLQKLEDSLIEKPNNNLKLEQDFGI